MQPNKEHELTIYRFRTGQIPVGEFVAMLGEDDKLGRYYKNKLGQEVNERLSKLKGEQ